MNAVANPKTMSAEDAANLVSSGMTVALGNLSSEPVALTEALWRRASELRDITIVSGMMLTGYPFLQGPGADAFRLRTWFMPGTLLGGKAKDLKADFLPLTWAQTIRYLDAQAFDVALIQVSPADRNGYHSFGINTSQMRAMIRGSGIVIAQVNEAMPRTMGNSLIHSSELDVLVHSSRALIEFPHREGDATDGTIGDAVADLVPDGATLQFGIGTIPSAALGGLVRRNRKELNIISQMTDPARRLIESGVCHRALPVAQVGDALGTQNLYAWLDQNPAVHFVDGLTTHSLEALANRRSFVSINSALEIDLYGQFNSEMLDGRQVGGIGGSVDFGAGTQFEGNRSIIGLRSRTGSGKSRIVPNLALGPVTVSRTFVQFVVTEYGVADLRNRTVRERAESLIAIAHPDDRAALTESLQRMN